MRSRVLVPGVFALLFASAHAVNHYVSPLGNDAGAGSFAQPFRTIQQAADIVNPGDSVLVLDGTYTYSAQSSQADYYSVVVATRGGNAASRVVFRSKNKWGAVLDGTNTAQFAFNVRSSYLSIENFEMKSCTSSAINSNTSASYVRFAGNHIHNMGRVCSDSPYGKNGIYQGPGTSFHVYDGNVWHDIGRLAAGESGCQPATEHYKNHDHGLYLSGNDITITNNIFYSIVAGWPVQIYGSSPKSNINIVNNTFAFPTPFRESYILVCDNTSNILVQNNLFYEPRGGAVATYGDCASIQGLKISNNLSSGALLAGGTCTATDLGGNVENTNPGLLNPAAKDFHLTAASPAVNAGAATSLTALDIDRIGRPQGSAYDIGAYEYKAGTALNGNPASSVNPSGAIIVHSAASGGISIGWNGNSKASAAVYTLTGQQLASFDNLDDQGSIWSPEKVTAGIYVVRVRSEKDIQTKKVYCGR